MAGAEATNRPIYSWKEDPPRRCISRSLDSIGSLDAYPFSPSHSGQLFRGDAEIRGRNAATGGNGGAGVVGKTRSLLTGTEPRVGWRARKRKRKRTETEREKERDIGQNCKGPREKRKGRREKKSTHTPPPAGPDETHACDPMAYRVSMPIRLSSRTASPSPSSFPPSPSLFGRRHQHHLLPKFRFHSFSHACRFFSRFSPLARSISLVLQK